jgi:hypothetical protein
MGESIVYVEIIPVAIHFFRYVQLFHKLKKTPSP